MYTPWSSCSCSIFAFGAFALSSCGGSAAGKPAEARHAEAPTATSASHAEACAGRAEDASPWVVDLDTAERGKLGAALQRGVVVVSYACNELRILDGCKVAGSYAYQGTGFNEGVLHLDDVDSARATLAGGATFAAKIAPEMKRGAKLVVDYDVVGESNTTVAAVARTQLGARECKGATHFVGRASLGAFRITTGANAEVASAGKREICQKATSSDTAPIGECDALLRIRLVPIVDATGETPPPYRSGGVVLPASCPAGTVRADNVCVSPKATPAVTTCKPDDAPACEESCKKGDGTSCALAGLIYEKGKGGRADAKKAMEMYEAACANKSYDGCAGLGFLLSKGQGVPADKARAAKLFETACEKGNARACSGIGHQLRLANDVKGAIPWLDRSCQLGYARACFYAGALLMKSGDPKRAFDEHARACDGDDLRGCLALASLQASGAGGATDTAGALANREKALYGLEAKCSAKDADACEALGDWYMGVYDKNAKKPEKAVGYYATACAAGVYAVCMTVAHIYENGEPPRLKPDKAMAMRMYEVACVKGADPAACKKSGPGKSAGKSPGKKKR